MPEYTAGTFEVKRLDILDSHGNSDRALMPSLGEPEIKDIYHRLVLARAFDQRVLALQREGRMGTYASILGQEASQVASAYAAGNNARVFPSYRETGALIALGYPLYMLFQYWSGDERGMRVPDGMNIFPVCISVGSHVPHAVGAAMAARIKKEKLPSVAYFGDGATSKGDFHEGANMAGAFNLPVVLICQNNQWAISLPRSRQSAAATLAQKAIAYGFEGIQVDGNDVFAVYTAVKRALDKARDGKGPSLIECFTYRLSDHTTADNASRYRSAEEVEHWKKLDPLARLGKFMEKEGMMPSGYAEEAARQATAAVDEGFRKYEEAGPPSPEDMFLNTFKTPAAGQMAQLRGFSGGK
ncbi:MAG: pyruvate dehydrogenase (acetyl-transferring) E1 component subunit alpha [Actinomycetota bacterium]|nr:pyruvate dehydrogenase (acetyl-transferring) E1 component subunit alpha [Actinomycetota bacterium]